MKKLVMLFTAAGMLALGSCKDKNEEPAPPPPAPVAEPAPQPAPQPQVQDEENDGTSISLGSDGMSVESKNGDNKTDVQVSPGNKKIEVKTEN